MSDAAVHHTPTIAVLHDGTPPAGLSAARAEATLVFATADDLGDAVADADVLLVWDFASDAVPTAWPRARRVRWVHTASAGVDRVAFPELLAQATLTNSRGVFDTPIAEYVLGLVLAMAKDLPTTVRLQDAGRWRHRETELVAGTRAVVVGGGPIGRAIARMLAAVGMRVRLVGRTARADVEFGAVAGHRDLPSLVGDADVLVLAAPLTEQTRGMVDADLLARCRPGSRLVNVGRGPLVVTDDLLDALRTGHLAGAALDVLETEPLPSDHPLWTLPGVVVSPHMSGDVRGWRELLLGSFLDNLTRFRTGRPLRNVVDPVRGYVTDDPSAADPDRRRTP